MCRGDIMHEIHIILKDTNEYGFIINKKLLIGDYELVDELEYIILEIINYMKFKYSNLILEVDKNE